MNGCSPQKINFKRHIRSIRISKLWTPNIVSIIADVIHHLIDVFFSEMFPVSYGINQNRMECLCLHNYRQDVFWRFISWSEKRSFLPFQCKWSNGSRSFDEISEFVHNGQWDTFLLGKQHFIESDCFILLASRGNLQFVYEPQSSIWCIDIHIPIFNGLSTSSSQEILVTSSSTSCILCYRISVLQSQIWSIRLQIVQTEFL